MSLTIYTKKRHFAKTPEPKGGRSRQKARGLHYVIQKHAASRLHYDFPLELDGTLKSWAVPKGPSLDPARKALAVRVEDHPLAYETFEGVIPKGQYGGGTVMVWDRGTWEPLEDPQEGLKRGKLRFALHGTKLQGEQMTHPLDMGNFKDTYREQLESIIDQKKRGRKTVEVSDEEDVEPAPRSMNLMEALKQSLEAKKPARAHGTSARRRSA